MVGGDSPLRQLAPLGGSTEGVWPRPPRFLPTSSSPENDQSFPGSSRLLDCSTVLEIPSGFKRTLRATSKHRNRPRRPPSSSPLPSFLSLPPPNLNTTFPTHLQVLTIFKSNFRSSQLVELFSSWRLSERNELSSSPSLSSLSFSPSPFLLLPPS